MEKETREKYKKLTEKLIEKGLTVTTMESCTSGLIASLITDSEGASAALKGAFVTYSNEAKIMQGVPAETIENFGVYSKETAAEMAKACRRAYSADIGIGITGTFGNLDPNNPDSVAGKVFFAFDKNGEISVFERNFSKKESRFDYKIAAAKEVADELEKLF
ncbi:MAG: CinA family protein [Oscillospiraceae bacterium]|nr:CinA family protein [Oscillospiraceae bacterium]